MEKKSNHPKKIVFDLDGVICTQTRGDYNNAEPIEKAVNLVNRLYESGHTIIIYTARFMNRYEGDAKKAYEAGFDFTKNQLDSWGVKYHRLVLGKPPADVVIDDRSIFWKEDWDLIAKEIDSKL